MNNEKLTKANILTTEIIETEAQLKVLEEHIEKGCINIRLKPTVIGFNDDIPISTKYLKIAFILEKEDAENKLAKLEAEFAVL